MSEDMIEEWRSILDGFYEVSNMGRVRRAKPGNAKTYVGKILTPIACGIGYLAVEPSFNGKHKRAYVHRLVAAAFIGPCPDGYDVNHKDGNKQHNAATNLEYMTRAQNCQHAYETGLHPRHAMHRFPRLPPKPPASGADHWMRRMPERIARGEGAGSSKMTAGQVDEIRTQRAAGMKQNAIARQFGISTAQVSRIVNKKHWRGA